MAEESPATDILKTTLEVKVGEDVFEFRIPSIHDEIRVGARIKDIRRALDPSWNTFDQGLDGEALVELRACACFEVLLQRSSAKWPWSKDAQGKVVCDSSRFPTNKFNETLLAYQGFQEALSSFRSKGTAGEPATGEKAVAGE